MLSSSDKAIKVSSALSEERAHDTLMDDVSRKPLSPLQFHQRATQHERLEWSSHVGLPDRNGHCQPNSICRVPIRLRAFPDLQGKEVLR